MGALAQARGHFGLKGVEMEIDLQKEHRRAVTVASPVFNDEQIASGWLNSPKVVLEDQRPIELM